MLGTFPFLNFFSGKIEYRKSYQNNNFYVGNAIQRTANTGVFKKMSAPWPKMHQMASEPQSLWQSSSNHSLPVAGVFKPIEVVRKVTPQWCASTPDAPRAEELKPSKASRRWKTLIANPG